MDFAVNGFTAFDDMLVGRVAAEPPAVERLSEEQPPVDPKTPKSIFVVFVKTLEAERKLMEKHSIESQQIDSRPFA